MEGTTVERFTCQARIILSLTLVAARQSAGPDKMSSRFYLSPSHSSNSSLSSDNDSSTLPFPKPLSRSSFLDPDFSPSAFLSTLTSRFQTLEDLRSELSQLSQQVQTELVDLVNDNYTDFLSLGSSLSGGEEKIEEIRLGMLGFERDVQGLRERIGRERERVAALVTEKREVMKEISVGRGLLEIEERIGELEVDLRLRDRQAAASSAKGEDDDEVEAEEEWSEDWNDEGYMDSAEEHESPGESSVPQRLRKRAEQFLMITALMERFNSQHPFLMAKQGRIRKVQETLLLDIDAAIRAEPDVKGKQEIMRLRSSVEE